VRVRKSPTFPLYPIEPNKLKLLMMGFVLSVGMGGGLVVLAIFLDRTFSTVEGMEKALGVTVIGTLPLIVDDHFERKKKLRLLRWVTIILGIIVVSAIGFLVIYPRLS
jgi:Ni,Fe-hydrogenase I cytochrome b subunit